MKNTLLADRHRYYAQNIHIYIYRIYIQNIHIYLYISTSLIISFIINFLKFAALVSAESFVIKKKEKVIKSVKLCKVRGCCAYSQLPNSRRLAFFEVIRQLSSYVRCRQSFFSTSSSSCASFFGEKKLWNKSCTISFYAALCRFNELQTVSSVADN